jgi:hypothetical protein
MSGSRRTRLNYGVEVVTNTARRSDSGLAATTRKVRIVERGRVVVERIVVSVIRIGVSSAWSRGIGHHVVSRATSRVIGDFDTCCQ